MTPPINLDGDTVDSITIDGTDVSEVTVDGTQVVSAIPDSVIHHYNPGNFTTSNWSDEIGSSDISTISGLIFNSSGFSNNGGVSGDGTDHGLSNTMGNFGSSRDTDFAISVPFNTSDDGAMLLGHDESGVSARTLELGVGVSFHGASSGELSFSLRDSNGNKLSAATSGHTFNDSNDHHLILNKTSNSAGGLEFYVDDMTTDVGSNHVDTGFGNATVQDFDGEMGYFCRSQSGSPGLKINALMGNIRWFDNSLTENDRKGVDSSLPWT